jgi:hypothetical protein
MKTTTTKVGLMAVILMLLAILAGDYVLNSNRNINSGGGPVVLSSPRRHTWETGNINGADATSTNVPRRAYAKSIEKHRRQRHAIRNHYVKHSDGDDIQYNKSADYNAIAVNSTKKPEVIALQTSKDHYGHLAVDDEATEKNHLVHFGLEAGYNQNGLTHNSSSNIQRGGFHAGAIADIGFSNHFSLQPGLLYIVKGTRLQNEADVENKEKLALNYLEVPINLVFKIGKVGNAQFLIGGGPYFSYLLKAKDNFQSSNFADGVTPDVLNYVPETPYYQVNKIRNFDYGLGGFVGAEVPEGLFIKAGGEFGMRDIQQKPDGTYDNRNYSLMVSVGYLFGY